MKRKSLTDRQKAALTALDIDGGLLHPGRVAVLCGDRRPSAGHGWRNTLGALERLGLVRADIFATHGGAALYRISDKGREALHS